MLARRCLEFKLSLKVKRRFIEVERKSFCLIREKAYPFCLKSGRLFMQKRASESTSKPGVGEVMGDAKELSDKTHLYATLRET